MKICLLNDSFPPVIDGVVNVVIHYANYLIKDHAAQVIVGTPEYPGADYTAYPYNRIIIFDSPANYDTALFEDTLLSLFYREIYMALVQSIRDPFNQFISKWLVGDEYQPVALFNMPYSFIEGNAYLAESSEGEGLLNDGYFLGIIPGSVIKQSI